MLVCILRISQYVDFYLLLSFSFENFLNLDYNLLEDMKRVAESARRMRTKFGSHFRLPLHLKSLRNAAGSRKTKLLFLLRGMSKREKNQSRYDNRLLFLCDVVNSYLMFSEWLFGA